jgi:hypothetical protein
MLEIAKFHSCPCQHRHQRRSTTPKVCPTTSGPHALTIALAPAHPASASPTVRLWSTPCPPRRPPPDSGLPRVLRVARPEMSVSSAPAPISSTPSTPDLGPITSSTLEHIVTYHWINNCIDSHLN